MAEPAANALLSAFAPAGPEAATILHLFWIMAIGAALVWVIVCAIAIHAMRRRQPAGERKARWLILAGGVTVPTIVLGALLTYGLLLMPPLRAEVPADAMQVRISGEQWWWRVAYEGANGQVVASANELRLPVGEPVVLTLSSPDVIHSFWIPALAGKVDMIPGRDTRLVLRAGREGVFRGVCAEFCGASHAHMRFLAVAMPPDGFDRWLQAQAAPAAEPASALARRGRDAFLGNGCGACHAVRGTTAVGNMGPDLTHVGSRLELAAGTLPNDGDALRRWITAPHHAKPEALMPAFDMLPAEDVQAIASWLESLQ
ncbi:MAG: cytochrome c oxidase subunit II [Pseudomonadota bacterium]|nr:cytochrome c oxidase subunit II [Pseudomonadota bacterium]